MIAISGNTRWDAWLGATEYLIENGEQLNLVLSIEDPATEGPAGKHAREQLDGFYAENSSQPLHTVAETIFPGWEYKKRGLHGMFETYEQEYRSLKVDPLRWGTYAHRIMSRSAVDGTIVNPLLRLIEKMRQSRETNRQWKACYELGVSDPDYDIPIYDTVNDQNRRRALPCLVHLSFKLYDGTVHLTAIYRSHEYIYKTPGNLLGLARLQACVAHEAGVSIGTLVVHSTYAFVDLGKARARELVECVRP